MNHFGLDVFESPVLPVQDTVKVCDVDSKEELLMNTGQLIHVMRVGNNLHVSAEYYKMLTQFYQSV